MTFLRLSVVFALVALTASRLTLVGHELLGHGGAAVLSGCDVVGKRLFLFGGGWVSYSCAAPLDVAAAVRISLAGVGFEIAFALALLAMAAWRPRGSLSRVALSATAMVDLLHAGYYLAAGTHHGFGDGSVLHRHLGDARPFVVLGVSLAVVVLGALLARRLAGEVDGWLAGVDRPLARAGLVVAAAAIAAAAHGGLTLGERALRRDDTYARIMRHESEREVARDLARYARDAEARGRVPTEWELAAARAALERQHRRFPLRQVLAAALAFACLFGLWWGARRRGQGAAAAPGWRALVPLGAACAAALALVALLDAI